MTSHGADGGTCTRRTFLKASLALTSAALFRPAWGGFEAPFPAEAAAASSGEKVVRTVCAPNCTNSCGVNAFVKDGKIIKIEPADFPDNRYRRICLKGMANAVQRVYHPERVKYPLRRAGARGEGRWERITWETAYREIGEKLTHIAKQHGSQANSWIGMTGDYGIITQMVPMRAANCLAGTTFTNLGIMSDLGANMGFLTTLGVHQEAHEWTEARESKLLLLFGCNVAETALNDTHFLLDAIDNGARVVVVDPRFTRTAAKARQWVPIRPGTDTALILGLMQVILQENLFHAPYLLKHSSAPFLVRGDTKNLLREKDVLEAGGEAFMVFDPAAARPRRPEEVENPALAWSGNIHLKDGTALPCRTAFEALRELCKEYTPDKVQDLTGVDRQTVRELALAYARTDPASIWISQGTQRYYNGHQAFRAAIGLGALCGNIGKRHAGVNWAGGTLLRLILATPPAWLAPGGASGKVLPGTRMHDVIASGKPYPVKSLWALSYGMGTQTPRFDRFVEEALPNLDLFVITEQVMTPATHYADYVLPCTSLYEEEAALVGSWNNMWVQSRRQVIPPLWEARSNWRIFQGLFESMGKGDPWRMSETEACRFILQNATDPLFNRLDWEELQTKGVLRAAADDPHIPFKNLTFPTPSGRIELYCEKLTAFGQELPVFVEPLEGARRPEARKYPLTLMNTHSVFSVNSQHTILDWIHAIDPEPRLEIHPHDAIPRDIAQGDLVTVHNDRGAFTCRATLTEGIRPGALNICQGWWPKHFQNGHYAYLAHLSPNPAQDAILETNYAPYDILVEVKKADGKEKE